MFPSANSGGGGTDFTKFRPGYTRANTSSTSPVTAVSVQGSGMITSIFQGSSTASASSSLKLTIDGVVIFDDATFSSNGAAIGRSVATSPFYTFNQSFLLEHSVTTGATVTTVTYLLN